MAFIKKQTFLAFQETHFSSFVIGRLLVNIALHIQAVIVSWQMYALTKDPLDLGLIGLAEAIPAICISLYAGYAADHFSKKKIILTTVGILWLCSLILAIIVLDGEMFTSPELFRWVIFSIIFVTGLCRGFLGPAIFSFLPTLFKDQTEKLKNAITWNSSVWQFSYLSGPVIGGLLYAWIGFGQTYIVVTVLLALGGIQFLRIPYLFTKLQKNQESIWESLQTGLKYVMNHQIIFSALTLDLFAVLFGGAVALLPIYAAEILFVGPSGLGLLRAAIGIGALSTAIVATQLPIQKNAGKKMLYCVGAFGICTLLFGISTNFWWAFAFLFLSGVFDGVSVLVRQNLIQLHTPEHMKGRISAVNNMFIGSSNEIGSFESGLTAKWMGPVAAVVFGSCMTLAVVVTTYFKAPKLRDLDL